MEAHGPYAGCLWVTRLTAASPCTKGVLVQKPWPRIRMRSLLRLRGPRPRSRFWHVCVFHLTCWFFFLSGLFAQFQNKICSPTVLIEHRSKVSLSPLRCTKGQLNVTEGSGRIKRMQRSKSRVQPTGQRSSTIESFLKANTVNTGNRLNRNGLEHYFESWCRDLMVALWESCVQRQRLLSIMRNSLHFDFTRADCCASFRNALRQ